jgi:hypothetical protein
MSIQPGSSRWKVLAGSTAGTSHTRVGTPCQDYSLVTFAGPAELPTVVLVCADGAGSSSRADRGAKLASITVATAATSALDAGLLVTDITSETAIGWYEVARRRLALEACIEGLDIREYACTLLLAIVCDRSALFVQIGDGAIVFRANGDYQTAFWPQSGEYANTTNFLSARDFHQHLGFRAVSSPLDDVALITDGLQPLALHNATRTVHAPFFDPMFAALRSESDPDRLEVPLRQFLTSTPVTTRTDDDTTLILATRCPTVHDNL